MNDGNGRRFGEALLLGTSITAGSGLLGMAFGAGVALWIFAGLLGLVVTAVIFCWPARPET